MKLYTRTVCPKCMWIKSELQRSSMPAEIVNVDHDEQARQRLMDAGIMSVPVLEVNGQLIVDSEQMMKQLEALNV